MQKLEQKSTSLGLELGSTRIKAVLAGPDGTVLASGAHDWQNRFEGGYWTYHLDEVWTGVQHAFRDLARNYEAAFGEPLRTVGALGVSAMMHGYLPFDRQGRPLTAFRTWRNTTTRAAAEALTERFRFNIPQRWTVAHFYQAILNGEDHVRQVDFLTTLAGYLHWQLTGQKVLGIGDASGVFPIDSRTCDYDAGMLASFDELLAGAGLHCHLRDLLSRVLCAGQDAGTLTEAGARLLDPTGTLGAGIPLCPPEGDAGTGMAATDSVAVRTGNVSAGTSVFAMVVLEKPLAKVHPEIDLVTTPDGRPVAMVHCNTCTSDLDDWVRLLGEMAAAAGATLSRNELYTLFYRKALEGDPDCGGLVNFNCFSGEPVTGLPDGRPLLVRRPDARFTLANFARVQLYACLATLKYGGSSAGPRRAVQGPGGGPETAGRSAGRAGLGDADRRGGRSLGHGAAGGLPAAPGGRRNAGTVSAPPHLCGGRRQHRAARCPGQPRICRVYETIHPLSGGGTRRHRRTAVTRRF